MQGLEGSYRQNRGYLGAIIDSGRCWRTATGSHVAASIGKGMKLLIVFSPAMLKYFLFSV